MIKKKFLKLISLFLGFLLTSCEVSSVNNNGSDDPGIGTNEYGTPSAEYKISGYVKDTQDNPIEGIQVSFQGTSVLSDTQGEWNIDSYAFPCDDDCQLFVEDIDGEDNGGEFQNKTVDLNLQQTEEGSGGWDEGTFEEHSIEIIIEEVVDEP